MQRNTFPFAVLAASFTAIALSACEKPTVINTPPTVVTTPGPAGPAGPQGESGKPGSGTTIVIPPAPAASGS